MSGKASSAILLTICFSFSALADNELEEITVTATRRLENAQNVPISITAITASDLVNAGITGTDSLEQQTPGLVFTHQNGGANPSIRGVGSPTVAVGFENGVATYLDGVYLASPYGTTFSFNNIDRVEVLKGPQGTLFGRNATAGVVQVVTKNPSEDADAYGSLSYGNFQQTNLSLYGTTGVAPHLAADFSAVIDNQGQPYGHNYPNGSAANQTKESLLRSKWLWTPTDDTTVSAWFSDSEIKSSVGNSAQFLPGVHGPDGVTTYTGNWQNSTGGLVPDTQSIGRIGSLEVEHDFGALAVKSISAYQHQDVIQVLDSDRTPLVITDLDSNDQIYRTYTEELQLLSNKDSYVKWIVGGFFMHDITGYGGPIGLGLYGSAFGGGGVGIHDYILSHSYATFAEATVPLVYDTNLTVGARYTKDQRELDGETYAFNSDTFQSVANKNIASTIPDNRVRADFTKPTFRAILDHHFTQEIMVYGGFSRGFKSGNFNLITPTAAPFKPEVVDSIEVGVKTEMLDRHLKLNASLFHYKYDDIQVSVNNGTSVLTTNAAAATVKGVDIDGRAVFNEHFDVGFGAEYLNAIINSFHNAPYLVPNADGIGDTQTVGDASGNKLPNSPKYTFNAAPGYTFSVPNGKVKAGLGLYYNAGFYWDFTNIRKQGAFALLNATLGWQAESDKWGFRLFGNNLTNREYSIYTVATVYGDAFDAAPPRTYGIEFNFNLKPHQ